MKTCCFLSQRTIVNLCTFLLFFSCFSAVAQSGKNGSLTVNSLNTVVNCYSVVTASISAGTSTVTTDNSCTIECGDLVMIYQAQGASINTLNTDQYGTITGYNSSGFYEFNYVVSNSGGVLTVQSPWVNNYSAAGMTQIIKVPQYTTLTVNAGASIVPLAWQDVSGYRKGGVVAIHATGTVLVNGSIKATAYGFRPGSIEQNSTNSGDPEVADFLTTSSVKSAEKGEGIAGFGSEYDLLGGRYGRGAPANGGGGGNGHNAGGGGGSNANNGNVYNGQGVMCTSCAGSVAWTLDPFVISNGNVLTNSSGGGRGGYTYASSNQDALTVGPNQTAWGGDNRKSIGGYGGKPLSILPASRIFFGGGGGAGDSNNSGALAGGTGGGIVYIIAPVIAGSGTVVANGGDALNQVSLSTSGANDAPSGGGGGGTIILKASVAGSVVLSAIGGKGGDQGFLSGESEGPGGGGGGGFVAINAGSPPVNVQGGANGITLSASLTEFLPNGATSGSDGQSQTVSSSFITYNPVSIAVSVNTPVCSGGSLNFTSTVNYPGGTYAWSGPAGFTSTVQNPTIVNTTIAHSGTYQVIYTSPGGCKDTAFQTVVVNQTPVIAITPTNPLCAADCNGNGLIGFTTNGTAPYNYLWSNGQTTQSASNLCAGNFTVTVTDFNGCTVNGSVTIAAPLALTATVSAIATSCFGSCNGSITVVGSGGTGSKQYSLNGGAFQASGVFTGLCAGTYTLTVKDANNCTFITGVSVTQPTPLSLNLVASIPTTCGLNNGSITASASGGTTAYTYSIGGAGQSSGTFNNLAAGSYSISVTDGAGCVQTITAVVTSTSIPVASILTQQNVSCFGGSNGSALIGITGGTSPYNYSINGDPAQTSNYFTSLSAGNYSVVVTDVNGCATSVNFSITSPSQLSYTSTMTPVSCNGLCDGGITITASGGTGPFTFSTNNGSTFSTNNPITGLCAGIVDLVVQDLNGCLVNSTVIVTEPTAIAATLSTLNPTCHDVCNGQITVVASGGNGGYSYSIAGGTFQASPILTGVCSGLQQVFVQDLNGCQLTQLVTLANPPEIIATQVSMVESNCGFNSGSMEVQASGMNTPFQYSLNGGAFQSTGIFTNLFGGGYELVVMDALGCLDSTFFGVNDVEMDGVLISTTNVTCNGGNDGAAEVANIGGFAPITFVLDNNAAAQINGVFTGLEAGSHIAVIYDGGLCVFTLPFDITEPDPIVFSSVVTDVTCAGGSDGQVQITPVSGGTGAYQYSIDNGATYGAGNLFTGLSAGLYPLVVRDANSCSQSGQAILDESSPISITANFTNLVCFGDSSGLILLGASGGNGGYQYSIDNGASFFAAAAFSSLAAGVYPVVINDQFGCFEDSVIVLTEPNLLTATHTATPELCTNACNGTVTINPTGGTASYMYSLDNGNTFGVANTMTGLCDGNYTILVQDQHLCTYSFVETISAATALVVSPTSLSSTCSQPNGAITLSGSGGNGIYSYSIDNGQSYVSSGSFSGLPAASYLISVQDGNGCVADSVALIVDQASPFINGVFVTETSCNSVCDGTLMVDAIGGSGMLNYSIGSGNQVSNVFSGLCAGTYDVVISDINGCSDTATAVVGEPVVLSFASTATDLTCNQNASGSITVVAQGGTIPYQYSYDNGLTFTSAASLQYISAGVYNLIVKDDNGCNVSGQEIVAEPTALMASVAAVNPTCFGSCDGTATVVPSGGTAGYTATWLPNSNNASWDQVTDLCAGYYSVTVTDQNGCQAVDTFQVIEPALYTITNIMVTNPTCFASCNGSITVSAVDGTSFSFDGGVTTSPSASITSICAGDYSIQVVNSIGCVANASVTVTEPAPLMIISTLDSLMCMADTVPLFAFAYGGTQPYQYLWDNGVTAQSQDVHPASPVTYSVFATDSNGCVSPVVATNFTMLPPLAISLVSDTTVCLGSTVELSINVLTGNQPYSFSWNSSASDTLSELSVTPLVPSQYTATVSDLCYTLDTIVSVGLHPVPQFAPLFDMMQGCSPLTVSLDTVGLSFLDNCMWTFSDGQVINGCNSVSATFTDPGCYDLTYTGSSINGCPLNLQFSDVICVFTDPIADFTYSPFQPTVFDNQVQFTDQSIGADSYQWNYTGYGSSTLQNPTYTFYGVDPHDKVEVCLEVMSFYGCVDSVCKTITFNDEFLMYVPNTFTPDGDEYNNTFYPVFPEGSLIEDYTLIVFDRWGEIIFESMNPEVGWDGSYHGKNSQDGTYTWLIELREGNKNERKKFVGHVSLLR
jgi:large repetitive protein